MTRFNAILGIITACFFTEHSIGMSLFLQEIVPFSSVRKVIAFVFLGLMLLHAVISLIQLLKNSGSKMLKPDYWQFNRGTYVQRYTGIAILAFIALHLIGYGHFDAAAGMYVLRQTTTAWFLCECALSVLVGVHLCISLQKAALALGWIRGRISEQVIVVTTYVWMLAVVVYSIWGFICYFY